MYGFSDVDNVSTFEAILNVILGVQVKSLEVAKLKILNMKSDPSGFD